MVADLSRITSLDRPPEDWDWRADDRARRARALARRLLAAGVL